MRAYLALHADGSGVLGRREADGQWSAMKVSHESLAGGLLREVNMQEKREVSILSNILPWYCKD